MRKKKIEHSQEEDEDFEVDPDLPAKKPKRTQKKAKQPKPKAEKKVGIPTYAFQLPAEDLTVAQLKVLVESSSSVKTFTVDGSVKLGKIVDIYDGDTVKLNTFVHQQLLKFDLRLQGYDSAQMKSKIPEVKECATALRDRLRKMLLGKVVKARFGKTQKYGRTLATLMVRLAKGGQCCLNDWLIGNKFVLPYQGATKVEYTSELATEILKALQNTPELEVVSYE